MDFIGFSFNGQHSSKFGLYRVSDGSRYNEDLFANFQDTTTQIPGGDGLYYFRTNATQRTFSISVAFDNVSEKQFRAIRKWLNPKVIGPLIFDEWPYKAYSAKVQAVPQFKYICFDSMKSIGEDSRIYHNHDLGEDSVSTDSAHKRVYKGEGTIQFVCNFPYATSVYKYLDEYSDIEYPTKGDWKRGSGMKCTRGSYDGQDTPTINLYNPGDIECDSRIFLAAINDLEATITISQDGHTLGAISLVCSKYPNHYWLCIDSRTNLIVLYENSGTSAQPVIGERSNLLYNNYIVSGDFFKIPLGESTLSVTKSNDNRCFRIQYDYLYY